MMKQASFTKFPPMQSINQHEYSVSDLELVSNLDAAEFDEDHGTVATGATGLLREQSINIEKTAKRTRFLSFLVVLMGTALGSFFLYLGITHTDDEQAIQFEKQASDLATEIDVAWRDYERAALWIHQSCQDWRVPGNTHCSREGFELLFHYLSSYISFEGMNWVPNITDAERAEIEANSTWHTKNATYTGFMGQEPDPDNPGDLVYTTRSEQPFYFPLHYAEPSENFAVPDYDLYSAPWEQPTIQKALDTWEPAVTGRFKLVGFSRAGYSVAFYHPGVKVPEKFGVDAPRDLASMVITIYQLLEWGTRFQKSSMKAYLYDKIVSETDGSVEHEYLDSILVSRDKSEEEEEEEVSTMADTQYDSLRDSDQYYEEELIVGGRTWVMVFVPVEGTFNTDYTSTIIIGVGIFLASVLIAMWMLHNMNLQIKMHRILAKAAAEASIVADMFPPNVRDRMIQDAGARNKGQLRPLIKDVFARDGAGNYKLSEGQLKTALTSEGIFGSKPIAELHPYTTVMFADIRGFSAWASIREPSQVISFLEIVYNSFDRLAKRRNVFKVETVRDMYMAVAGLPEPNKNHAVVMAKYATDCAYRVRKLCHSLEKTLGPDTGDLSMRVGLHSGQVIAGVVRGEKGRFQLFGDTVHKAMHIEMTCPLNKIHISQETAQLLIEAGHDKWCTPNDSSVAIKGRGIIQTYYLQRVDSSNYSSVGEENGQDLPQDLDGPLEETMKTRRLVEWNVEVLSGLLRSILARRGANTVSTMSVEELRRSNAIRKSMVLDEVVEVISLPKFDARVFRQQANTDTLRLDSVLVEQLTTLVEMIASMYRDNPFHNFAHASHVVMSVVKMLSRIVDPKELAATKKGTSVNSGLTDAGASVGSGGGDHELESELHDHTFGITSDPLTQFAVVFSALIHDLDHHGVPNNVLVKEESPLAKKYKNKSILEQNSVDLLWEVFMQEKFDQLRTCLCKNESEFSRFRALVVNAVMATDVMDKELGAARVLRWNKAFNSEEALTGQPESMEVKTNRKATIVIEHLIQASDISHTMQHWHVYVKWNESLYNEMYKAYREGRLEKDPTSGWYEGELGFFDHYIIPLTKKLFTCGVFGVSSDEYLNNATINRKEWAAKGASLVKQYLANAEEKYGSNQN